jgi:hypothetical protein
MTSRNQTDRTRLWATGLRAAAVVTALNVAVLLGGRAADVPFEKPAWDGSGGSIAVTPAEVIFVSMTTFLIGVAFAWLLARRDPRRLGYALVAGGVFTLLSLGGPLSLETDAATKALLASMHLVSGAGYISFIRRVRSEATSPASPSQRGTPLASPAAP